ncbi:MAG: class I SAM-dependent methyltransferase [Phycisphaerae bacterium]|nr:methyltransferase domain-containing protein [Tepidisphaeraceae bacterium]
MGLIDKVHGGVVHTRRVRVLADRIAPLFPQNARVLDIGCGDGLLAKLLMERRPDVTIEGVDVLVREGTHIPVRPFDGKTIDAPDKSFDATLFVDVLHHTDDAGVLVAEAKRLSRNCVVIKDHTRNGLLAGPTLRFMDRVGNARYGVALPYNYLSKAEWDALFARQGLKVEHWEKRLGLYPWPASWVFGRGLHFVARLGV